ncbi:MAG: hypothetical protein FWE50_02200 [Alphaproteobacteria bacterium]|nr:hypothetical protein [Alphaproteobacteria bacterium]
MSARNFQRQQRGAGLMEVLLAIAIIGAILPFAYNGVMEMSNSIVDASEARRISEWSDPIMAYVRRNQADWPDNAEVEFDEGEVDLIREQNSENSISGRMLHPYAGFIEKRAAKGGAMINAYLAFRPENISEVRVLNIAKNIGSDAAIVALNNEAVSPAGWSISSDLFSPGDLIFRISDILGEDEASRYLHRTYLDDPDMNTMFRDLNMAKKNMVGVGTVFAKNIKANNANIWFAETPEVRALDAYFPDGASIDPSKATLASVRVSGDISGFRRIVAKKFTGATGTVWSQKGDVVVDSVNVTGPVHVQRDLVLKSDSIRTMSGFAGIRAHVLATPFVSTEQLFFAGGFGMTISSELMYSTSMNPIKLGAWIFPSERGPKFSGIVLRKISSDDLSTTLDAPKIEEFGPIISSDWKTK